MYLFIVLGDYINKKGSRELCMSKRINYDEFTVNFENTLEGEALSNYYSILINFLIDKFGKDPVRIALEELIEEGENEKSDIKNKKTNN